MHVNIERIVFNQVPCIGRELPLHVPYNPRRPKYSQSFISSKKESQQVVKTYEVVYVGVGYEDIRHAHDFSSLNSFYASDVKEDRSPLPLDINIEARVFKWIIYKPWMEYRNHKEILNGDT